MDALQDAARAVTSKPVQRAAVQTILLVSSAVTLFCFAAVASALFFQNFVPDQFVTVPVHLQYGAGTNPYGIVPLTSPSMKSQQDYDISVTLSMPRSPANVERGNFMVTLHLLDIDASDRLGTRPRGWADGRLDLAPSKPVFSSRRPALVPYVDPIVSVASRILFLLYHILVPSSQTQKMTVRLADRIAFSRAAVVPASAYIEIEAGQDIQIYSAALTLSAQLRGLRWLMFHYRLPTYLVFTFLFWVCEMVFMGLAWMFWGSGGSDAKDKGGQLRGSEDGDGSVESDQDGGDNDELSDHPHTFPTYGKQPPLKHEPRVKREDPDEIERLISDIPAAGTDADDEYEMDNEGNADIHTDSGIGTSYSEEGSSSVRRRASRN